MRNLDELNEHRCTADWVIKRFGGIGDKFEGAFLLDSPIDGGLLRIVACRGHGWDHVSVSRIDRCPVWEEMEFVKRTFFKPTETAMQLHVPVSDHISCFPFCLHLWRPRLVRIPTPPTNMV